MREEELSRRVTIKLLHRMLATPPRQRTTMDREFIRFLIDYESTRKQRWLKQHMEGQWNTIHSRYVRQFEHWLALFAVR
nr:hypothetical protein [Anaerolineae bacterium]